MDSRGETDDDSVPKSTAEEPPSTPEMDAREAEEMVNSMMRNSSLPDAERSDERLLEEDGSEKLLQEGGGEKLIMPYTKGVVPFVFPLF